MKKVNTKKIVFISMFAALTCVFTMFVVIPTPATQGFINIGDSMIILCAFIFGGVPAMISGAIGSALADILLGYAMWAPFTFVIKGLEGLIIGLIASSLLKRPVMNKLQILSAFIAMIVGLLWMAVGYAIVESFLYGFPTAIAGMPNNLIQAGMACAVAFPVYVILTRSKIVGALRFMNDDYDKLTSRHLKGEVETKKELNPACATAENVSVNVKESEIETCETENSILN